MAVLLPEETKPLKIEENSPAKVKTENVKKSQPLRDTLTNQGGHKALEKMADQSSRDDYVNEQVIREVKKLGQQRMTFDELEQITKELKSKHAAEFNAKHKEQSPVFFPLTDAETIAMD